VSQPVLDIGCSINTMTYIYAINIARYFVREYCYSIGLGLQCWSKVRQTVFPLGIEQEGCGMFKIKIDGNNK